MIPAAWLAFLGLVLALLALDLFVFHRRPHAVSIREALLWTGFWILLALLLTPVIHHLYDRQWLGLGRELGLALTGRQAALQYLTAYVIEKSLSVDNLFVIALVFSYFRVPAASQHRVLFWGILGSLVMRGAMIVLGVGLLARLAWTSYLLGGLLLLTAARMLIMRHDNFAPERNALVRLAARCCPIADRFDGDRFFTRAGGRRVATPLLLALLMVESSDLLFAVDSVPAALAVSRDPFIVFSSNTLAVLGMRSLYFALAGILDRLRHLKTSLVFLLAYVGVKMALAHHVAIPTLASLAVIGGILAVGVLASLVAGRRDTAALAAPPPPAGGAPDGAQHEE